MYLNNLEKFVYNIILKMMGVKLNLISDIDIYKFIEKRIRGGVRYIEPRHNKANNKYMILYDKDKPSQYI